MKFCWLLLCCSFPNNTVQTSELFFPLDPLYTQIQRIHTRYEHGGGLVKLLPQYRRTSLKLNKIPRTVILTLLVEDRLLSLAFGFGLSLIRDFAGHGAGHIELVDVESGLTEG